MSAGGLPHLLSSPLAPSPQVASEGPIGEATRAQPSAADAPAGEAGGGVMQAVTGAASAAAGKAGETLQAAKEAAGLGGGQHE